MKLAIGIPTSGLCKSAFAQCLAGLCGSIDSLRLSEEAFETAMFLQESSAIHKNREKIVQEALKWGATHILWLDDDMTFTPEAVRLLFTRKRSIVIGNYPMRVYPLESTAINLDGSPVEPEGTGIKEIAYGGLGFALIDMKVFKDIEAPYFMPYWREDLQDSTSEDAPFFEKARLKGYKVYCDLDASRLLSHVGIHHFYF